MSSASARPDLRVNLGARLALQTPVVAASGCYGYGDEIIDLAAADALGALITPTVTLAPRAGSPMPRTAEASAGLLHSLGWPNPGLLSFLSSRLPQMRGLPCPIIVSIYGADAREWRALAEPMSAAEGISGLELNLGRLSNDGEAAILSSIRQVVETVRCVTTLPLIAKLPAANVEIGAAARAAAEGGADVIAVSQGFPGVAVRLSARAFRLPGRVGELSGPCIKPLALYQVARVAEMVDLPILGSGGIMTGSDALEFLVAGASAVAVGIASSIHPNAIAHICSEISSYLERNGPPGLSEFLGNALETC